MTKVKDAKSNKLSKIFLVLLVSSLVINLVACGGNGDVSETKTNKVRIEFADYGQVEAELYPDIAPKTVENFQKLIEDGFYNGLTIHRIEPGFVIQGGDPNGDGTGGPGWYIEGEFSANGHENNLKHTRGVLSMARAMDPNSAGSQFFIMLDDAPHLDGQYAAFGKLTSGMEEVDKMVEDYTAGKLSAAPVIKEIVFLTE